MSASQNPAWGSRPGGTTASSIRHDLETYIRRKPLEAMTQATLVGVVLRYFPVRAALSAAIKLAVPGILALGLYRAGGACCAATKNLLGEQRR